MDKKKLLEEKNKLEADYDRICKECDAIVEEYDDNINDDKITNICLQKFAERGEELDEICEKRNNL